MMEGLRKKILFASVPKHDDLYCITAVINTAEKHDPSAKSNYHWQILKCRQIIFCQKEIIASPVLGNERHVFIVMTKQFYATGKIQAQLKSLNMQYNNLQHLTNAIYESCLRYTMIAHLAPQWNQVENYLVQGRNFLVTSTPLNAIKLEIGSTESDMFIVLSPVKVRLPPLKFDDLEVPAVLSQQFLTQATGSLSDMTIGAQWVHVLPSLKRGRIISVDRQIPKSCPYQTYKDMKRHWKNSYGYRLPESDADITYYTLSFHPLIPTKYTYPDVCLRPERLVFHGRVDELAVMRAFLTDLARKVPRVCGRPFVVDLQVGTAVPTVTQWGERANLAVEKPNDLVPLDMSFLVPAPSQADMFATPGPNVPAPSQADTFATLRPYSASGMDHSANVSLATPPKSFDSVATQQSSGVRPVASAIHSVVQQSQPNFIRHQQNVSETAAMPRSVRPLHDVTNKPPQSAGNKSPPKYIPYSLHTQSQQAPLQANIPPRRYVPQFTKTSYETSYMDNNLPESAHGNESQRNDTSKNLTTKRLLPQFAVNCVGRSSKNDGESSFGERPSYAGRNVPTFGDYAGSVDGKGKEMRWIGGERLGVEGKLVPTLSRDVSELLPALLQGNSQNNPGPRLPSFNQQLTSYSGGPATTSKKNVPLFTQQLTSMSPNVSSQTSTGKKCTPLLGNVQKRSIDSPLNKSLPAKKPRSRPQVQSDVDVAALAAGPGLTTVNAATLVNWLRGKNVQCGARDKKQDLVDKVNGYLNVATQSG